MFSLELDEYNWYERHCERSNFKDACERGDKKRAYQIDMKHHNLTGKWIDEDGCEHKVK